MSQKSTIIWIVVIVIIVIVAFGWWHFTMHTAATKQNESSQKSILSFVLVELTPAVNGVVDNANHTVTLMVPQGTDLTMLIPTITTSNTATIYPASDQTENFTHPIVYTVTAQDGSTQTYKVTVSIQTDTIKISSKSGIGQFLTDSNGMTLYYYLNDTNGSGQSTCTGQCATLWPPFYPDNVIISSPLKITSFSTILTANGQQQLTYKGWPLYYYAKDTKPGDVNGQGLGKVWYVVKP